MLDLAFLGVMAAILLMGLKRPFLWVLGYIYVDIVAPQKISWGFLASIPISLLFFLAAFGGWLVLDKKAGARFTFRQFLLLLLLVYCGITTLGADFPEEALTKWDWVWKALVFAIFLPLTLTTRGRIQGVLVVMVLSASAIIINGGIKTVLGGGGYGTLKLLVDDNTGLYEGSIISCVAISIIPLVLYLAKHGTVFPPDWRVKLFAAGLIFACVLMPVGTQARTGLVCLAFLAVLMLRSTRRRFLYLGLMGAAAVMAVPFLPQSFLARMSTIENHESDQSASTRMQVWAWTLDYVKEHPFGGGFEAYRSNKISYRTRQVETAGSTSSVKYVQVVDEGRAYHSAYFEMLGEQGWPGLILWLWLNGLGIWHMEVLRRRWKDRTGEGEQWQAPLANALQQAHLVYLAGALFVGIAYQPFVLMLVGVQCGLRSYLKRVDRQDAGKPVVRKAGIQPIAAPAA